MLAYAGENAERYTLNYGNIAKATVGAIQRAVAVLEDQGGDQFFGEPALEITDWLRQDEDGRGIINILACRQIIPQSADVFHVPACGCCPNCMKRCPSRAIAISPALVFFFDEAHLLYSTTAPKCCWIKSSRLCG